MTTTDTTTTLTVTRNGQSVTFEHVTGMAWEGQADLRQVTPFKSQSGKTHALRTFLIDGVEIDAATPGLARQALDALRERQAMLEPNMSADEALGEDDILPGEDAGTEEPTFTVEMWTTDLYDGSTREIYARSYPTTTRKHDAIRNLATYALATPEVGPYHVRVPRKHIRVNSAHGVAWDTRNDATTAYFRIVGA
jgi:hypothetical protein